MSILLFNSMFFSRLFHGTPVFVIGRKPVADDWTYYLCHLGDNGLAIAFYFQLSGC